jgi:hypothetical protein
MILDFIMGDLMLPPGAGAAIEAIGVFMTAELGNLDGRR